MGNQLANSHTMADNSAEPGDAFQEISNAGHTPEPLPEQNLETLNIDELTPLSPDVIARQATINIGTIGHVAHGKSTLVKAISGVQTVRFKNELERNITIKLGYANAKIYKCDNPECAPPGCYRSYKSSQELRPPCRRPGCGGLMNLERHVSFVDCPGHDILMATMLNGAAVMDAALLLVAGNESCPQPQTSEHLAAIEIMRLQHILIMQNKVDLVKESQAAQQYKEILNLIQGTVADGDEIEVRPGIVSKNAQGKLQVQPILSRIVSLFAEHNDLQYAVPGGLIGVGTFIDPMLCRADRLVGKMLGAVDQLPPCYVELEISFFLLRRLLGVKTEGKSKASKVAKLTKGEVLMLNIGSLSTGGRITAVNQDLAKVLLSAPVCARICDKIALSRRLKSSWRLVGWGSVKRGKALE